MTNLMRSLNWLFCLALLLVAAVGSHLFTPRALELSCCQIGLGSPLPVGTEVPRLMCGNFYVQMDAYCPLATFREPADHLRIRYYNGSAIEVHGNELALGGQQLSAGMAVEDGVKAIGKQPLDGFQCSEPDFLKYSVFEFPDSVIALESQHGRVRSFRLIQKFCCPEQRTHRCGFYEGWWIKYLNTCSDPFRGEEWPFSVRKSDVP